MNRIRCPKRLPDDSSSLPFSLVRAVLAPPWGKIQYPPQVAGQVRGCIVATTALRIVRKLSFVLYKLLSFRIFVMVAKTHHQDSHTLVHFKAKSSCVINSFLYHHSFPDSAQLWSTVPVPVSAPYPKLLVKSLFPFLHSYIL